VTRALLHHNRPPLTDLQPVMMDPWKLTPLGEETRTHPPKQIRKMCRSIRTFGFVYPVLADEKGRVIAGWALVLAAREMRLTEVPVVTVTGLAEARVRMLRLALNRLAEDSHWNRDALRREFSDIMQIETEIEIADSGFEVAEIDAITIDDGSDQEDELPRVQNDRPSVTQLGDMWIAGQHKILCADACNPTSYARLLERERVDLVFTDPPYNVAIEGHVSGLGATKHPNFVMGAGELSAEEFQAFLRDALGLAARYSRDGAIHFCCMDWRGLETLFAATRGIYSELKNLVVWNKTNAGMGSLYRSKHELIVVYKVGTAAHVNNVSLGRYGRNRTNVWDYAGQTALRGAKSKLHLHPTLKPVALVADAIRDCCNRDAVVLDPFGGAATTAIAAEKTGRRARLIELDPKYVDASVRRWQRLSGASAVHLETGRTFDELAPEREADHAAG
jgi:DNA modification methylase